MLIKILGELENQFEADVLNTPQALAAIRHTLGADVAEKINSENYYYLLAKSFDDTDVIALHPQMVASDFNEYDTLLIVPHIGGNTGLEIGALVAGALGATGAAATAIAIVVDIVVAMAVSMAIGAVMQLLSPTLSFEGDPAAAQKLDSALFNGAPNIREQGGSVPIIVGNTHAGGVLISAGISSEEKTL